MKWRVEEKSGAGSWELELNAETVTRVGDRHVVFRDLVPVSAFVSRRKEFVQVWVKGHLYEFRVQSPEDQLQSALKQGSVDSEKSLLAKMPGKVLDVKVKNGDQVPSGQVMVVLEAMKMENHLHVPFAVTVASVQVKAGQIVESGQTLVVFQ